MINILPKEIITQERNGYTHTDIIASQSSYSSLNIHLRIHYVNIGIFQVDLEAISEINQDDSAIDSYHCIFLAKHPNDMGKSDKFSRFWPQWYRFTRCSKKENLIYEEKILI